MNDLPRHTLSRIIAEHGRGICDSPKRVEALLRDLCGAHRREINIIIGALEERVAADLIMAGNSVPREVLLARLAARLRDNLAYTPEAARWGVETWAVALGILSEAELEERARTEAAEAGRSNAQPTVQDPKPPSAKPASTSSQTPQPKRGTTYTPPQQPSQSPKTSVPPIVRSPAPAPPRRTPAAHPSIVVPGPPQQNVPPSLPTRQTSGRGLTLRGCLISLVLIIILIVTAVFVVPAVILLLQEEQAQPSINDPRIR
ncbi:MAG: hypothetical protein LC747_06475 [Acidobacteria bacterium]|nr:hypothetical protein [Acidobacteriota bacterium]